MFPPESDWTAISYAPGLRAAHLAVSPAVRCGFLEGYDIAAVGCAIPSLQRIVRGLIAPPSHMLIGT
jgi:hypothetical protein